MLGAQLGAQQLMSCITGEWSGSREEKGRGCRAPGTSKGAGSREVISPLCAAVSITECGLNRGSVLISTHAREKQVPPAVEQVKNEFGGAPAEEEPALGCPRSVALPMVFVPGELRIKSFLSVSYQRREGKVALPASPAQCSLARGCHPASRAGLGPVPAQPGCAPSSELLGRSRLGWDFPGRICRAEGWWQRGGALWDLQVRP